MVLPSYREEILNFSGGVVFGLKPQRFRLQAQVNVFGYENNLAIFSSFGGGLNSGFGDRP